MTDTRATRRAWLGLAVLALPTLLLVFAAAAVVSAVMLRDQPAPVPEASSTSDNSPPSTFLAGAGTVES